MISANNPEPRHLDRLDADGLTALFEEIQQQKGWP